MKLQDLYEVRDVSWFHNTSSEDEDFHQKIENLISTGVWHEQTHIEHEGREYMGTSLTRSAKLAMQQAFGNISFELEPVAIKNNNKVLVIDHFPDSPYQRRSEAEEFVVGNIRNFARAIKAIRVFHADESLDDDGHELLRALVKKYPRIKLMML